MPAGFSISENLALLFLEASPIMDKPKWTNFACFGLIRVYLETDSIWYKKMKKKEQEKIVLRTNEQGQVAIERYIGNVVLAKRRQRCFHTVHMYMHHTFEISTNSYVCNEDL
ncbi:hypothetical protein HZH68_005353 [Vespula germanica]|uniref:Uncharacterized protein n=1 Tax=Vespula germanica TaxID=30212 RepID=A0A834KDI9_VESGE|nr:hypothetical protein HZH68_005353 [Vespula germanica]